MDFSQQQKTDYEWFKNNLENLYAEYGHCWLVIQNYKVLGHYDSFNSGVNGSKDDLHLPLGSFIVQETAPKLEDLVVYIYSPQFG